MCLKNSNYSSSVQWIATLGVFILMMQVGITISWASPNIVRLTSSDSDIPVDEDQASWLLSIAQLFGLVGALLGFFCNEYLGSRSTIILALISVSIGWVCMIAANSILWLFISRAFSGITVVLSYTCFSLYLGEVANPKIRGTLISIAAGGNPFGVVVGTISETYLPRKISSSIYLVLSIIALALFLWLRHTAYYLVRKNNLETAQKSIRFYHDGCDEKKQLYEIIDFIESYSTSKKFQDKASELFLPVNRKALLIIITLFILPHISGTILILSYMETIIQKAKTDLIEPEQYVIYANITSVISTFLTFPLIDKLGRRFLLIVSSIGTTLAMAGLGTHFYLLQQNVNPISLQWLPVICILGYLVSYSIGFSPVPSTVLSELFNDNVKTMAALMATLSSTFFSFLITKSYQPMVDWIGESYVFWSLSVLSFVATPYALYILPETKGKTFQEIQDILQAKKY